MKLVSLFLIVSCMIYQVSSQSQPNLKDNIGDHLLRIFQEFRSNFKKTFSSISDLNYRLQVFKQNVELITESNSKKENSYTLGVNYFTDLTFKEFSNYYLGNTLKASPWDWLWNLFFKPKPKPQNTFVVPPERKGEIIDWRNTPNVIGPVKNQMKCGSCWAFTAVTHAEHAMVVLKGQPYQALSPQELLDCNPYGFTCNGGLDTSSLDYIKYNGVTTESIYPYTGRKGLCQQSKAGKLQNRFDSYSGIESGPEATMEALKKMTVTMRMGVENSFQFYSGGIYNPITCSTSPNHVFVAIGYDLTGDVPYFTILNSWDKTWGEQGFGRIAMTNGAGVCQITAPNSVYQISS